MSREKDEVEHVRRLLTRCKQEKEDLREENKGLRAEVERLQDDNNALGKVAHQLRGALQSIADGIGDQKTAQNALDRLASQGVDELDVDPEEVGIKGRIEELEAEVERLRSIFVDLERECLEADTQTIAVNHALQFVCRAKNYDTDE